MIAETIDQLVHLLDELPDEPLRPPPKFELYALTSIRMTDLICRLPAGRERDDVLSRYRDAILRLMLDPSEPSLH